MDQNTPKKARTVKCPQCGHSALYSPENAYRPFCSERCRLIDLGAWASENYKVPVQDSSSFTLNDANSFDEEE